MTVTLKDFDEVFPTASVAAQVTVVVVFIAKLPSVSEPISQMMVTSSGTSVASSRIPAMCRT